MASTLTDEKTNTLEGSISEKGFQDIKQLLNSKYSRGDRAILTQESLNAIFSLAPQGLGPKADSTLITWYFEQLLKSEGSTQFMYLDTKGNITLGKGTLLLPLNKTDFPSNLKNYQDGKIALQYVKKELEKIKKFKFITYKNVSMNTQGEVRGETPNDATDDELLKALEYLVKLSDKRQFDSDLNYKATSYFNKDYNNVYITQETIDEISKVVIQQKINDLRAASVFSNSFNSFPAGAQLALLDMAYNLNPYDLHKTFPNFTKLVKQGDWTKIAFELDNNKKPYFSRKDVPQSRNDATKILFILAAESITKKEGNKP